MRIKRITTWMIVTAIMLSLAGCGKSEDTASEAVTEEVTEEALQDETEAEQSDEPIAETEVSEDAATVSEDEPEEEPLKVELVVGDVGYSTVSILGDKLFAVRKNEDDELDIIDNLGNKVFDETYKYASDFGYNNYFYVGNDEVFYLYDSDKNLIMDNSEYAGYYFERVYKDGIKLNSMKKGDKDTIYIDWDGNEIVRINDSVIKGFEASGDIVDGKIPIRTTYKQGEKDNIPAYMNVDGSMGYIPYDNEKFYDVMAAGPSADDGEYLLVYPFPIGSDVTTKNIYIYSFKDNSLREIPAEGYSSIVCYDGVRRGVIGKYFYAWNTDNDNPRYAVYDVENGKYMTDYDYQSIGMGEYGINKYILASDADGEKWGYLDENFQFVGEWYDDATSFTNGVALITEDGKMYAINEDFEKISDPIEGDGGFTNPRGDYAVIYKNDKKYITEIKRNK